MSQGIKRVVIVAPTVTATRPTAVPALGTAYDAGQITDQHLSQIDKFAMGKFIRDQIVQLPIAEQISTYNSQLSPKQQSALRFAGYTLPGAPVEEAPEDTGGWSGGLFSDALHVVDNAATGVIGAGGEVLHGVGAGLSWANNKAKAAYRQSTTYGLDGAEKLSYMTPVPLGAAIIDNAFHDNAAENGETFYNGTRLKDAQNQIGNDTLYFYAKQVSEGKDLTALYADLGGDETKIAGLTALTESDQFTKAVDLINSAHVSPGRDLADSLGLSPEHKGYGTVSGLTDGMFTVLADPLLLTGPIGKSVQASKYGLSSAGNVGKLFEQTNVQRYMGGFAGHLSTITDPAADAATKAKAMGTIRSQYSSMAPMLDEMVKAEVKTPEDIRDFLSSTDSFGRILQGKPGVSVPLMPYRTWAGDKARTLMARANPLTGAEALAYKPKFDVSTIYDDVAEGGSEATTAAMESILKSRNSFFGRAATFISRPAQKVPLGKRIYFDEGNAQEQVYRLARYIMPKYWANNTSVAFLDADTAGKYKIMRGLMETMGEVSGVTKTSAGRTGWNKYMDDLFGETGATHAYAPEVHAGVVADDIAGPTEVEAYTVFKKVSDEYSRWKTRLDDLDRPEKAPPADLSPLEQAAREKFRQAPKLSRDEVAAKVAELEPKVNAAHEAFIAAGKGGETVATKVRTRPDMLPNGQTAPVLSYQHRDFVDIPDFKEFYRLQTQLPMMEAVRRGHGLQLMGRVVTNEGFDWFTHTLWKPGVLLRPALPLRNSGEEAINYVSRYSARDFAKGLVGQRYIHDQAQARVLESTWDDATKAAVAGGDWKAGFTGWMKWRAKIDEKAYKALNYHGPVLSKANPQEEGYLRDVVDFGGDKKIAAEMEDTLDARMGTEGTKSNQRLVAVSDSPWEQIPTYGDGGAMHLANYATKIANTPDGRIVLENLGDRETAVRELMDWLDNSGAWMKRSSRMVKDVGDREWAERAYDTVRATFSAEDGTVLDDMARQALNDRLVKPDWIVENLPSASRPRLVPGQRSAMVDTNVGVGKRAVNWGYEKSEQLTKKMSRMPTFLPQYVRHRTNYAQFEAELAERIGPKAAKQMAHEYSHDAAMRDMLEYVDNPEVRSQAAVILRNVMPFYRAQEEFYTRWAKTGVFNPYAFRKMQLTYQGLQNVGTIHKDEYGNDVFDYPLVGEAAQGVTKALAAVGIGSYVPVPIASSSQIKYLNQGLDPNNILPSFGPGPAILMGTLRMWNPKLENFERLVFGDLGAGKNPFMNLLPTPVRRIIDSDEWKANNTMSAAAYMEYAGKSPPADATPEELQAYKEKLQSHSTALSWMKMIAGAFLPASPTMDVMPPETAEAWRKFGKDTVDEEFWSLVEGTGDFSGAMAAWVKLHPDTMPFTVGKSETPSGAVIDANAKVGSFINGNSEFFEKYKSAAPYWLSGMEGETDWQTRDLLFRMGLQEAKSFEDFYSDIKIGPALSEYYDQRDAYEAWDKNAEATQVPQEQRDAVKANYDTWSEMYKAQNPLVADYVNQGGSRAAEREATLQEVEASLVDPSVPKTASTNAIAQLMQYYRAHQGWVAENTQTYGTSDVALAQREAESTAYNTYMAQFAKSDPAAEMVWNMLLRYQS